MLHIQSQKTGSHAPLISFIVTYYDLPAELLAACLQSIVALPIEENEREIVVVDDGSNIDARQAVADACPSACYLRVTHGGLSRARNAGIEASHGHYLQFIDGDDMLLPGPYAACWNVVLQENPDLLFFRSTHRPDSHHEVGVCLHKLGDGATFLRHHNLRAQACGYLFKRSVLGSLRFMPDILHEDEDFTPRLLLQAKRVCSTPTVAYFYRIRSASITQKEQPEWTRRRLDDTVRILLGLNSSAHALTGTSRQGLQRRVEQLTIDYLYNAARKTASFTAWAERVETLRRERLFPPPIRPYTSLHAIASTLLCCPMGRHLFFFLARLIQK